MSKHKPLEEILAGWNGYERPTDGDIYEHYKKHRYEIVATGFLEDSETPCVIYRSFERKAVWVRTAKNFLEDVEHDGQTMPRFSKV